MIKESNSTIPKRIILIQSGPLRTSLPPLMKGAMANLKLLNSDFECELFDDDRIRDFVNRESSEYRSIFESFRFPIQRLDFFRYLAIYRLGGFYFDLDVLCWEGLSDLLETGCVFTFETITTSTYLGQKYGMYWEIANYGFGARSGHPFIGAIIENCIKTQEHPELMEASRKSLPWLLRKDAYVFYSTGPGLVTRTYAENPHLHHSVKILFPEDIYDEKNWYQFGRYGVHLMAGYWKRARGPIHRRLLGYCGTRAQSKAIERARMIRMESNIPR
jgi:mannosyltransferase OCH1-like enzyme